MANGRSRHSAGYTLLDVIATTLCCIALGGLVMILSGGCSSAREQTRTNECRSRMRDVATAISQHEMGKGRYPGYMNALRLEDGKPYKDPRTGRETPVSWLVELFPYLDRAPIYDAWKKSYDEPKPGSPAIVINTRLYIELFTCPAAEADRAGAPTSFIANTGLPDLPRAILPAEGKEGMPRDRHANGVFFDTFSESELIKGVKQPRAPEVVMSRSMIRDPADKTLLFAEHAESREYVFDEMKFEFHVGRCETDWGCQWEPGRVDVRDGKPTMTRSIDAVFPSSKHVGGYNAAFVDNSVRFLSDNLSYAIYAKLLASDDLNTKSPGTDDLLDERFRKYPVADADLNP